VHQYTIGFDREQLALLSQLLASTGLTTAGVIRLALTRLAAVLDVPTVPVAPQGPQSPSGTTIAIKSTDTDPETDADF
jgi:hypothetical protein